MAGLTEETLETFHQTGNVAVKKKLQIIRQPVPYGMKQKNEGRFQNRKNVRVVGFSMRRIKLLLTSFDLLTELVCTQ